MAALPRRPYFYCWRCHRSNSCACIDAEDAKTFCPIILDAITLMKDKFVAAEEVLGATAQALLPTMVVVSAFMILVMTVRVACVTCFCKNVVICCFVL